MWCVSCRVEGHTSWDCQCPTFVCKCEEMSTRLTENYLPYFPTNEPWTHVLNPPKVTYQAPLPILANVARLIGTRTGQYRQTTLPFGASQRRAWREIQLQNHTGHTRKLLTTGVNGIELEWLREWGDRAGDEGFPLPEFI